MNIIGILQGRLSRPPAARLQAFPAASWRDEFAAARACGFGGIEWLVTGDGLDDNPIWTDRGMAEIRALAAEHEIRLTSLCADCFIDRPFVRVTAAERQQHGILLTRLIERSAKAGIGVVLVPVLEGGAILTEAEADELLGALGEPLAAAARLGIRVGLESDWPGEPLRRLIDRASSPALAAYYDVGNATSMGHDPAGDLRALGPVLCGVHIKDRTRGGGSVALGQGDADFPRFFAALAAAGYAGAVILETPAGPDPVAMARRNLAHLRGHLPPPLSRAAS
ncbi:MAG: sugar phosphate isomerase/epimerase family protein [Vicinamibacterales bacterium]